MAAFDDLEWKLRNAPADQGESRDPGIRVTWQAPFGVQFFIDPDANLVYVTRLWRYT